MPENQSDNGVAPTKHLKSLTIEIPSYEIGPNGIPVIFNCRGEETNIRVRVIFETDFECKGKNVTIDYSAIAKIKWTQDRGNVSVSFTNKIVLAQKSYKLHLDHGPAPFQQTEASVNRATESTTATTATTPLPSPTSRKIRKLLVGSELSSGSILPGKYVQEFIITLDPTFPPSCKTNFGDVTYLVSAKLHRDFPSKDIVKTQQFHVFKSIIPRPIEESGPVHFPKYSGLFESKMLYSCLLPPQPVYMGQTIPLLIRLDPALAQVLVEEAEELTLESVWQKNYIEQRRKRRFWTKRPATTLDLQPEEPIRVQSVCVKLKEYSWHTSNNGFVQFAKKQILSQDLKDGKGSSTAASTSPPTSASVWTYQMPEENGNGGSSGSHKKFFGPCPEPGQSWKQILMFKVPEMWRMNQDVKCGCLLIQHNFKVIMQIKVGNHPARELRIQMPLIITAPRPVRESVPALDLDQNIKYLLTK